MGSFFEGWYFKHQNNEETIAVIPGISCEKSFIQVVTNEKSYNIDFNKKEFYKSDNVVIGENRFSHQGIILNIHQPSLDISGKVSYYNLSPLKSDIMGPFRYFPMQCRHGVISMRHDLDGYISINGKTFNFLNGTGYIEKDSGRSFPRYYVWVQSNIYKEKCSIMASIADIPFAGFHFRGIICAILYNNKEYRMATYTFARVSLMTENKIVIEDNSHRLEIFISKNNGYSLYAPINGLMSRKIKESISCRAKFKFFHNSNLVFDFNSNQTSCEFVCFK